VECFLASKTLFALLHTPRLEQNNISRCLTPRKVKRFVSTVLQFVQPTNETNCRFKAPTQAKRELF
jgi:hypothetical protein